MIGVVLLVALCFHCCAGMIGGDYAKQNQFPYACAIMRKRYRAGTWVGREQPDDPLVRHSWIQCTGNLIHPLWVLTAIHCCRDILPPLDCFILVGGVDLQKDRSLKRQVTIIEFTNPIALLSFEKPLVTYSLVEPIALMTEKIPDGADIVTAGWGTRICFFNMVSSSYYLKYNWLKSVPDWKCKKMHKDFNKSDVACMAPTKYNFGPFKNDEGAGAVYKKKLYGIYLFRAFACSDYDKPSGFIKIAPYAEWIYEKITKNRTSISQKVQHVSDDEF